MTHALQDQYFIRPRTQLEETLLRTPELRRGLQWAHAAVGHPEPTVAHHVRAVLRNVDRAAVDARDRERLRLAAIVHDSFKYLAHRLGQPHGLLARRFLESYTDDVVLLELVEWHDEVYLAWRLGYHHNDFVLARRRLDMVIRRFGDEISFYHRFFVCDTFAGDKNPKVVHWFESILGILQVEVS